MRRNRAGVLAVLFVVAMVVPAATEVSANEVSANAVSANADSANAANGSPGIRVDATFRGAGGFQTGCQIVYEISDGTFHDPILGHGTYGFRICVELVDHPITFLGSFSLTTAPGATLTGTISGTYDPNAGLVLPVTITGGTQRFRHARGSLTIGPIVEHDFTNCDPRAPACLDWKDSGPIVGTITHVA